MTEAHGSTATPEDERSDELGVDETPPGGRNRKGRRAEAEKPEPKKKGLFARLALFYRQIVAELRKVVWPTRNELVTYTTVVIVFCLIIIGIVYSLDLGFARAALEVFG